MDGEKLEQDKLIFHSTPEQLLKQLEANPYDRIFSHGPEEGTGLDLRAEITSYLPRNPAEPLTKGHLEPIVKAFKGKQVVSMIMWSRTPPKGKEPEKTVISKSEQISNVISKQVWSRIETLVQGYVDDEDRQTPEKLELRRKQLMELLKEHKLGRLLEKIGAHDQETVNDAIDLAIMVTATTKKVAAYEEYLIESRYFQLTKKKPLLRRYLSVMMTGALLAPLGGIMMGGGQSRLARSDPR